MSIDERPSGAAQTYPIGQSRGLEFDPLYTHLRDSAPLLRVKLPYGDEALLVTRYEDVRSVLGDARFSRAATRVRDVPRYHEQAHGTPGSLMDLDPPEHTRLRRLAAKAFTVRGVERLRPRTVEIAGELLDRMERSGAPADLIEHFALPLPGTVICELLGVPYAEQAAFRTWLTCYTSTTALSGQQRRAYAGRVQDYLATLAAQRHREPATDLISALVHARDEDDRLSAEEVVDLLTVLLAGGYETTAAHLTNSVLTLLTRTDQLRLLRERPELIPNAVEELLRYVPLAATETALPRYATEDVELSGGTVRRGEPVLLSRTAANRDPAVFADPERLDLTRPARKHLAFGHGAHHCVGAPLARMNLQVALSALVERFPRLRLATAVDDLCWKTGTLVRGPLALPIAW